MCIAYLYVCVGLLKVADLRVCVYVFVCLARVRRWGRDRERERARVLERERASVCV
jgi:hypothetical protein